MHIYFLNQLDAFFFLSFVVVQLQYITMFVYYHVNKVYKPEIIYKNILVRGDNWAGQVRVERVGSGQFDFLEEIRLGQGRIGSGQGQVGSDQINVRSGQFICCVFLDI
jgi:hypothetical protein